MEALQRVKNMYAEGCGTRNMLGITWLGLKMLRESEICAMPWDKEGLFCTMPTTVPFLLHKGFLKLLDITKSVIQRSPMSPLNSRDTDPYQGAFQNLSPISLPKPAWLLQLIGLGVVTVGSAANIKSHKPDGEVEVRNIHARSMNEREGLSTWFHESFRSVDRSTRDS